MGESSVRLTVRAGVCALALALAAPQALGAEPLRVVTYNIFLGAALGKPERPRADLGLALERNHRLEGWDILALQEICLADGAWQVDYFQDLLRSRGETPHLSVAEVDPDTENAQMSKCRRAQATLSRFPILDEGVIRLPQIHRERRIVLWSDIAVGPEPGDRLRVYNVHLDNKGKKLVAVDGRWTQMQAVLAHFRAWRDEHPERPVIFLGDFNSVNRIFDFWIEETTIRRMREILAPTLPRFTPTFMLGWKLDWIFYGGLRLLDSRALKLPYADHFPVVADFVPLER
ncbi:MAG: endonuclease/exonuclease/phosphatase family protein [Bdellovibrionales bacterium]|nr:endonuclease/exonuclease/phosphatase family protein [Bdellovibrionales bacterium]